MQWETFIKTKLVCDEVCLFWDTGRFACETDASLQHDSGNQLWSWLWCSFWSRPDGQAVARTLAIAKWGANVAATSVPRAANKNEGFTCCSWATCRLSRMNASAPESMGSEEELLPAGEGQVFS